MTVCLSLKVGRPPAGVERCRASNGQFATERLLQRLIAGYEHPAGISVSAAFIIGDGQHPPRLDPQADDDAAVH
jgi:hypothetical protein